MKLSSNDRLLIEPLESRSLLSAANPLADVAAVMGNASASEWNSIRSATAAISPSWRPVIWTASTPGNRSDVASPRLHDDARLIARRTAVDGDNAKDTIASSTTTSTNSLSTIVSIDASSNSPATIDPPPLETDAQDRDRVSTSSTERSGVSALRDLSPAGSTARRVPSAMLEQPISATTSARTMTAPIVSFDAPAAKKDSNPFSTLEPAGENTGHAKSNVSGTAPTFLRSLAGMDQTSGAQDAPEIPPTSDRSIRLAGLLSAQSLVAEAVDVPEILTPKALFTRPKTIIATGAALVADALLYVYLLRRNRNLRRTHGKGLAAA